MTGVDDNLVDRVGSGQPLHHWRSCYKLGPTTIYTLPLIHPRWQLDSIHKCNLTHIHPFTQQVTGRPLAGRPLTHSTRSVPVYPVSNWNKLPKAPRTNVRADQAELNTGGELVAEEWAVRSRDAPPPPQPPRINSPLIETLSEIGSRMLELKHSRPATSREPWWRWHRLQVINLPLLWPHSLWGRVCSGCM